jgi:hypothetical protein
MRNYVRDLVAVLRTMSDCIQCRSYKRFKWTTQTLGPRIECMLRDMDSDDSAGIHNPAQLE